MEINSSQVDSHSSGVAELGPLILLVFYLLKCIRQQSFFFTHCCFPLCSKDIHTLVKNQVPAKAIISYTSSSNFMLTIKYQKLLMVLGKVTFKLGRRLIFWEFLSNDYQRNIYHISDKIKGIFLPFLEIPLCFSALPGIANS